MTTPPQPPTEPPGPPNRPGHQQWRDQLGVLALGHLPAAEAAAVRAHVDGCASCRAELAEIAPLAGLLDAVDPDRFSSLPTPPPDLGARIREAVAHEQGVAEDRRAAAEKQAGVVALERRRATSRRRRTTRLALLASAAVLVLVAAVAGLLVGRAEGPEVAAPQGSPRPYEAIDLREVRGAGVTVDRAGLVPHTWGVELELEGAGFDAGQTYRASFRTEGAGAGASRMVPAGEFRGVGTDEMTCHLQSSAMRDDVDRVVVTDAEGRRVLVAEL